MAFNYPAVIPSDGSVPPGAVTSVESWEDTTKFIWKLATMEIQDTLTDGIFSATMTLNVMTGDCYSGTYQVPLLSGLGTFPTSEAAKVALNTNDPVFRYVSGQGTDPMTGYEYQFSSYVGASVVGGNVSFFINGFFTFNAGGGAVSVNWQTAFLPSVVTPLAGTSVNIYSTGPAMSGFTVSPIWLP